ncbi:MAG TPA: diphosphomevalonate decarboxylase [Prolixibacteraceae bacterium]|nr:diphosphomevalonate decarboxylase [Prolixibacteraceae bacterium]
MPELEKEAQWVSRWRCPSNIALVKYWGKREFQKPMNQSLSFVLQNSFTETAVELFSDGDQKVEFFFEGVPHIFKERIEVYLCNLSVKMGWIENYNFRIRSRNSFPHSAGIASSASSFGALALCIAELHYAILGKEPDNPDLWRKASELARMGSGSACRSIYPGFSIWGKAPLFESCSDEYAIPIYEGINPVFYGLRDAILIVDSGKKEVSSSTGHALMNEHVYQSARIAQAQQNLHELYLAMLTGNKEIFMEVVESEALSLHALMMTSHPSYMLLKPNTLEIINRVRHFRQKTTLPVCFTLDAGPNIHLLYFKKNEQEIKAFIEEELAELCENRMWIDDRIGKGPERILS